VVADSTLFGTTTPTITDASDAVDYNLGTRFTPAVAGTATYGRWWFPTTIPDAAVPVSIGIYRVSDQTLLGSATFPLGATLGAWNEVVFSPPIPLAAGVEYVVTAWTPDRYVATVGYTWPFTSGDVTASASNGWLRNSADALAFPDVVSGNGAAYFADLVFHPDPPPVSTGQRPVRMVARSRMRWPLG
jgi:hypothetical protein